MSIIDDAIKRFWECCKANEQTPVIMIAVREQEDGMYPYIYYLKEFSIEQIESLLLNATEELKNSSNNAKEN